jgi:GNAT superfamily N-acetyltransferase
MDSAATAPDTLITTYLHMTAPSDFRPAFLPAGALGDARVMKMNGVDVPFYRFLYGSVGEPWRWRDRLVMPDDDLAAALAAPGTSVYVLYMGGLPAGYFELRGENGDVELGYFGLRPAYVGRGLGKHLLSLAIQQAWDGGAKRLWVHTCNLDAVQALDNYQKRGFRVYDVHEEPMPPRYV